MMQVDGRVETLYSKLNGDKCPHIEVIKHESRKQRRQFDHVKVNHIKANISNPKNDEKTNLRRLQNEIFKFTNHFNGQNINAKEELAIKLGAKPRKNNYLNYKQLKEKLKKDSEIKTKQEQMFKLPKAMVRTSKTNKRSNMKGNKQSIDIIKHYGIIKNKK